jgi:methylenetetrahydrofolate dehydrogenase (NADP+) / methenyltetrahydrofolate cyclohydrolase
VPGGVGQMTVAMLLHNTIMSYCQTVGEPLSSES